MFGGKPDYFQWLADLCEKAEGAISDLMWGNELVFRTGEVMFCLFRIEDGRKISATFRPAPDIRDEVLDHPDVERAPYPATGEWVFVKEDARISPETLSDWVRQSYELARREAANVA